MSADAADLDRALSFIIPERNARGRLVRLGPVLEEILSAHGYPPAIEALLAEGLVLTALLGAMLKDAGGQLTMQVQTEGGAVSLLVCDYRGGQVRGYIQHDAARIAELPVEPTRLPLIRWCRESGIRGLSRLMAIACPKRLKAISVNPNRSQALSA
jgi:molecular chaperone Hsp33